jgi:DNA-binding response OmpR family regulator
LKNAISELRRLFRGTPKLTTAREPVQIPILLASAREDDARMLRTILAGSLWTPVVVSAWATALIAQEKMSFPIVLCDRDLCGLSWYDGVAAVMRGRSRPAIILISDVNDQYLWDALVQAGGFDVLPRPFQRDVTLAMIAFAHTYWKSGWPGHGLSHLENSR